MNESEIYSLEEFELLSSVGHCSDDRGQAVLLDRCMDEICPVSSDRFSVQSILKVVPNAAHVEWFGPRLV